LIDVSRDPSSVSPPSGAELLAKLVRREAVVAFGVRQARTPEIARVAAAAGYDVLWVDLEHSTMPIDAAAQICHAALDLGLFPLVRTPERDLGVIGRLLDGGALGIIAPRIETADEAAAVVAACRFPPLGHRSAIASLSSFGFAPLAPAALYEAANRSVLVKVLIESPRGIDNVDAIAAVEGVDLVGIGANDLSAELGVPGETSHPRMQAAIGTALAACLRLGKPLVVGGIGDAKVLADWLGQGAATFLMAGIDTDVLLAAARERVRQAHTLLRAPR
jgi:4-hydroxy-2-oxoheptanedioate aldolase